MAYRVWLKPLAGKPRKTPKFSVCDIEAHKWVNFKLIGWYNGEEYIEFKTLYEFIEHIWTCDEKVIYAHFGGIYDFMFIIKSILQDTDYKIENMIPRGSGLLGFSIVREWSNGKTDKIQFKDSSAMLPFGLKRLTESFGVEHIKQDFDFDKWDGKITKKLSMYLKDDCRGLWEVIHNYQNWELIQKAGPTSTMASQALKVLRLFLLKPIKPLNGKAETFIRKGYFGGRTEIFRPEYHGKKNLYCYDVNSLYPFVMRDNEYPTTFKAWTLTYHPKAQGFYEATVEVPKGMYLPPLPIVKKVGAGTKLVFPTGTFSGVWSTIELEYAKSLGVKILRTGKGCVFHNGGHIFKAFVNKLYEMRKEAQAKGDGVGNVLTKLIMNSCYGRFGLNTNREQIVFDNWRDTELKFHSEIKYKKDGRDVSTYLMTKEVELEKTFTNVAIPAWVTSLARIHMHKLMMPIKDKVYYMDTDSIFTTEKMETGVELGELKEEYRAKKAVFLLPKTYVVEGDDQFKKLAMKGFDHKKVAKFGYKDFFTALEGDLRNMQVVHDAKFAKFKTAARKGNLTSMVPSQVKGIRSMYDKRTLTKTKGKWNTIPLHLEP